jgi:hypothetical protein
MKKQQISNIQKLARKRKYDEPLENLSVRIHAYQKKYLEQEQDASEWIRQAIDSKIMQDTEQIDLNKATKLTILNIIETYKKQLQKLLNNPFLKNAKENLYYMKGFFDTIESRKHLLDDKERGLKIGEDYLVWLDYAPMFYWENTTAHKLFLIQNDLKIKETIPTNKIPELIKILKQQQTFTQAKLDTITEEINHLQAKINKLEQRLITQ